MAKIPDYYQILQVHPSAGKEVIDAAYRKLALKYHPDRNLDDEAAAKMKQINQAYDVLSNPIKRATYDKSRGNAIPKTSGGLNFGRPKTILALVITIIILAKFKALGLVFVALAAAIWLLRR